MVGKHFFLYYCRSTGPPSERAAAASILAEESENLDVEEADSGKGALGPVPSEAALVEVETAAAAAAAAAAAGEAAVKAVLDRSGAG